jgi:hypothetical protein
MITFMRNNTVRLFKKEVQGSIVQRHCERSEAIQTRWPTPIGKALDCRVAPTLATTF